jgi:ferredoxin--NADP+ reductase
MHEVLKKDALTPEIKLYIIRAPLIATKVQPGQFVILRIHERGERIPLTVADFDREKGTITLIVAEIGKTTKEMGTLKVGESILDLVGPLGRATHIENYGTVACVGGGIGIAPVYPVARALKAAGNRVVSIIGARCKGILILEREMERASSELHVTTDDGSYGIHGFVTQQMEKLIDDGYRFDFAVGIGPVPMMKAFAGVTMKRNIKSVVSLNPIMVDGTGMCGVCRVEVDGKTRFACVDGPEFDAHLVDYDLLLSRQATYCTEEKESLDRYEKCEGACGKHQ